MRFAAGADPRDTMAAARSYPASRSRRCLRGARRTRSSRSRTRAGSPSPIPTAGWCRSRAAGRSSASTTPSGWRRRSLSSCLIARSRGRPTDAAHAGSTAIRPPRVGEGDRAAGDALVAVAGLGSRSHPRPATSASTIFISNSGEAGAEAAADAAAEGDPLVGAGRASRGSARGGRRAGRDRGRGGGAGGRSRALMLTPAGSHTAPISDRRWSGSGATAGTTGRRRSVSLITASR